MSIHLFVLRQLRGVSLSLSLAVAQHGMFISHSKIDCLTDLSDSTTHKCALNHHHFYLIFYFWFHATDRKRATNTNVLPYILSTRNFILKQFSLSKWQTHGRKEKKKKTK